MLRILAGVLLACACLAQPNLDQVVEQARKTFHVPGIAVAVVKDNRTVVSKGYGLRKLGHPAPVTSRTLFGIASNTKAFTAAALAMMVDEKKLGWDDRVIDHLPSFQMYDSYVTREMRVRDLLVHRSGLGLGAGDLMFFPSSDLSSQEIVRRLRFVRPEMSFRSRYAYDNVLYLVAGDVLTAAAGKRWDEFIMERIFRPVGITASNTSVREYRPGDDVATPHALDGDRLAPLAFSSLDNNAPAAAINSCVDDLARWVAVQLRRGRLEDGSRLFSAAQSREMWSPQTIIPTSEPSKNTPAAMLAVQPNFVAYGLGWVLSDYRGRKVVHHTGGLQGLVSRVTLVPEINLGIMVLTNQEVSGAFQSITYTVLDHYLGASAPDWVAAFAEQKRNRESEAGATVKKAAGSRNAESRPSLPIAAYAGRYRDAWYGDVLIEESAGKLAIRFTHSPALTGDLQHWHFDTFVARWHDRTLLADAYVTFSLKPDGAIDEVKMAAVSPLTDFSFDFHDLLLRPAPAGSAPK